MSENIVVPVLGESITEATVSKWLKSQGEQVNADEPIVELETEKVNVEVPSPAGGVISKINFQSGDTVSVGATLGTISPKGTIHPKEEKIIPIKKSKQKKKKTEITKEDKNLSIFEADEPENNAETEKPLVLNQPLILKKEISERKKAELNNNLSNNLSPAVRKIINEREIDVEKVLVFL